MFHTPAAFIYFDAAAAAASASRQFCPARRFSRRHAAILIGQA